MGGLTTENIPKICIIGAGFSGLCAGIKIQEDLNLKSFTIYDENEEVGGTWFTTTYPGCACDIPSHFYSFSFEPNPDWTTSYAKQPEILEYLKRVATKHDLYSYIKFNQRVKCVAWDQKINKWRVVVCDKSTDSETELIYDIVISGVGGLRVPKIPKEFSSFEGPIMHSATWDSRIDLEDKVVAVIGSGCSAVQIIPQIQPKVKKLLSFQRRPAWVFPHPLFEYPKLVKMAFAKIPFLQWLYRILIFFAHEIMHVAFRVGSTLSRILSWVGRRHLKAQIPDNLELQKKLMPNYQFGCIRHTPSNTYYKSLNSSNSEVITSKILEVKAHSILTEDGKEFSIDVLILATGYNVQDYGAPLEIIGRSSGNILSDWKTHGPVHYLGIVSSSCPNLFILLGPNTALGHSSVVFCIECQVNWVIQAIGEMKRRNSKVLSVKKSTEQEYMEKIQERMKKTVWGANECGSWYTDKNGMITALYPGNLISYWSETRSVDFSKLDFE